MISFHAAVSLALFLRDASRHRRASSALHALPQGCRARSGDAPFPTMAASAPGRCGGAFAVLDYLRASDYILTADSHERLGCGCIVQTRCACREGTEAMRSHAGCRQLCLLSGIALVLALSACTPADDQFDGRRAYQHVVKQCALGPRPVGSDAGRKTADYIIAELNALGWATEVQEFGYEGITGRNVIARQGGGPVILLGAHYDTRSIADCDPIDATRPVPGANDGASGVAVLLELARSLDVDKAGVEVWLAFFDAEDQGNIDGWPFCVGSSYMAENLTVRPQAVVVVDMIGDREQEIFWERNSDPSLSRQLWGIAAELGYDEFFVSQYRYAIIDDHLPFRRLGVRAVDIIDFDYPYWHTAEDTPDKVDPASLERVGRVLEEWLQEGMEKQPNHVGGLQNETSQTSHGSTALRLC